MKRECDPESKALWDDLRESYRAEHDQLLLNLRAEYAQFIAAIDKYFAEKKKGEV